ncbi:MAG: glycosyltransferase family 4 protein [Acidimicrobiia bacterium]|nr:glycosyltransferase family 4 protein [Acidimicrobiia bacterium]
MRVLLVTNDYPPRPGGIQQYLAGLVASLGAEVRVLAPKDAAAVETAGVVRGHRRFLWPTPRTRRWVSDHITEFSPDVVLFGAPHPLAHLGPRLRASTGVAYGVVCHGAEIVLPAAIPIVRWLAKYPLRRADVVFATSRYTAGRVRRLTKRSPVVIGAGVDPGFAPGPGAPADAVVGCVSRFVPRKGQRRVLRAVAALRAEGRRVSVLLVGTGRDERALRRLARRLAVPTRFEVAVPFSELPGLFRAMTVFAMPCRSRWLGLEAEGLGIVYLEAAATALPVIAGDSGGAPETVLAGETGFVVDGHDTLVEALRLLLEDPGRAAAMGAAGRAWVMREYSWRAVAERVHAGLEGIADHPDDGQRS